MTELTVTTDRDLKIAYIKKQTGTGDWIDSARDETIDKLIQSVNWALRNQCPECHTYFDNGDGVGDDRFCSDDCQVVYVEEAPDKGER